MAQLARHSLPSANYAKRTEGIVFDHIDPAARVFPRPIGPNMNASRLTRTIVLSLAVIGAVSGQANAQVVYEVLATFDPPDVRGANPFAGLVQGSDGSFYGTTVYGGPNQAGTVFRVDSNGTLTTLHAFGGSDGQYPWAGLIQGSDGSFYGTTETGGPNGGGTVFRIDGNGTLTTLYAFAGFDGQAPYGRLVQGSDGRFYGTTHSGGLHGLGTVFRLDSGGTLTTLHAFAGSDGFFPWAGLVQGSDGRFYGTSRFGGPNGSGTVFRIDGNGTLTTLYAFAGGNDGAVPMAGLIQGTDGSFYGTTSGGANGFGTVFRLDDTGTLTTLYAFSGWTDGGSPQATLVEGSDGNFYGTTLVSDRRGTVFRIASGGTLTTLHAFDETDGADSYASLIEGSDGSFYGTASTGGPGGGGVVFRLRVPSLPPQDLLEVTGAPATSAFGTSFTVATSGGSGTGTLSFSATGACSNTGGLITMTSGTGTCTIVAKKAGDAQYSRTASDPVLVAATRITQATLTVTGAPSFAAGGTSFTVGAAGGSGTGAVTFDASGACSNTSGAALITVTSTTGTCSIVATKGADANYEAATSGAASVTAVGAVKFTYEVLKTFDPPHVVGARPYAGLVLGSDGNFYGTTMDGGPNGYGTVFRIDNAGTLTTLHGFAYSDGAYPQPSLVQGSDGRFYGATSGGGLSGSGTVFRLESDGTLTTLRHLYGPTDGQTTSGALVQGSDGSFYGTAAFGGQNGAGTVFRIDGTGTLTTLHAFWGAGGAYPQAGLVLGSDGSFYGTTSQGGPYAQGTVYRIDSDGTLTTLHAFNGSDGAWPQSSLVQGRDGSFYGTTSGGGPNGYGTAFRIDSSGTLTTLHAFSYGDGSSPGAGLMQASDGSFYGTTTGGGPNGQGTVFRLDSGGTLTTLHQFAGNDGAWPYAPLVQASDGSLLGTTNRGGPGDNGVIFRLQIGALVAQQLLEVTGAPATATYGTSFTVGAAGGSGTGALSFSATGACSNTDGLALVTMTSGTGTCTIVAIKGGDGQYATTSSAPALVDAMKATPPTLTITGAPATAAYFGSFAVGTSGGSTTGAVTFDATGVCSNTSGAAVIMMTSDTGICSINATKSADSNYEAATSAGVNVMATARARFTYQVPGIFDPPNLNGAHPYAGLVEGSDGSFYGATYDGGPNGYGTVFRIDSAGTMTTLHAFGWSDGAWPVASLVRGSDGRFYGTTTAGGPIYSAGTVFRIDSNGTLTTLYAFRHSDGQEPTGTLVEGTDGNFYGTTKFGGPNFRGTVFRISTGGTLTTLHVFGGSDGAYPHGGLVQGIDGNFYGTTVEGGANGRGTVFRISTGGTLTTLHAFSDGSDGRNPFGGLVQGNDGRFYGTTFGGGANGYGTVFRIDGSGTLTTLYAFQFSDGAGPQSRMLQTSDGTLYGTTTYALGGSGSVFRLDSNGTLTTLHKFSFTGDDGSEPWGGLIQASDGGFYGTAARGGPGGAGLIYRLPVLPREAQQPLGLTGAPATAAYGTSFTVVASGGSGTGAVTFSTSGACVNVAGGAVITMTSGIGSCTIFASKAGDEQYLDVQSGAALVVAAKAQQAPLTITGAPAAAPYLASFIVGTTGGNGTGDVTFTTSGACSNIAPAFVQMTSGMGTCTITATKAGDENYLASAPAQVLVAIVDTTAPLVFIDAPDVDGQFFYSSPFAVNVTASDPATVASVSVNGVAATLISGTEAHGTWQAVLVGPASGVLTLVATATDGAGNFGSKTVIVDNDGIQSSIDRARNDYSIQQNNIASFEFNDGVTSGTVSGTPPFFTVRKFFGVDGVRIGLGAGTMTASLCGGTEKSLQLDTALEAAHVTCDSNGTTVSVEAVTASPKIELEKLTADLEGYSYFYRIELETGQRVSTGSPVTAGESNTTPIVVTIVQRADDGTETPVGSITLDPGESAELANVTQRANREDVLELNVLAGQVAVTLNGVEQQLAPGPHTVELDVTSPMPSLSSTAGNPTSLSPIHVSVVFDEPVQGFDAGVLQVVNAAVANFTGSGASYSFDLIPGGEGVVSVTIPAGVAVDAAGNGNVGAGLSRTVVAQSDQTVTFAPIDDTTYGAAPPTLIATASSGLPVTFAASGSCAVAGSTLTIVGVGVCTVTASQAGNDSYRPAPDVQRTFRVLHSWSGVLQPVNADSSSVFKLGSTVPVKFRLTEGSAAVTNLAARLYLRHVSNGVVGTEIEAVSTGAADAGNVFRYTGEQYQFNVTTKGLQGGTWELRIDLLDGQSRSVLVSLRK